MDSTPGPRRILVVDDEPLMRWSVAEALADQGFDVVSRGDAQGARAAVMDAGRRFDAVLLDLQLPDSVDLSLLRALRRLTPQTPLILMTAFATPELRRDALESGAFCVLDKPFEMDAVAGVVSDAAGHFPGAAN